MKHDDDVLDKVCTHPKMPNPDLPMVKCALCMRPLDKAKTYSRQGKYFCCEKAADQYDKSQNTFDEFQAHEKARRRKRLIKRIIIFLLLVAIAGGAYWYYTNNKQAIDEKAKEMKEKVEEMRGEEE